MFSQMMELLPLVFCPRGVNACFVLVCLAAVWGVNARAVMAVSAILYAALVWMG